MSSNYDIILRTLKHEGGYSNNPKDKGGETYCGISRVYNPTWSGWILLDKVKDKKQAYNDGFLYDKVVSFYSDKYFTKMGLSKIVNPDLRACIFDFCVNSGGAIRVVQSVLNTKYGTTITPDGFLGSQTINILNSIPNQGQLNNYIVDARKQYVQSLVNSKVLSQTFLNGILKRAEGYRTSVVNILNKSSHSLLEGLINGIITVLKRIFI